jgi:hypothetical protein
MNGGMKLSTLASAVHPIQHLGRSIRRLPEHFSLPEAILEKVRKGLTFFFHLKGRACGGDISDPSKSILENPS